MIQKEIIMFGNTVVVACDANCQKAWGVVSRPRVQLNPAEDDDFAFLADSEVGEAPVDPETYEGWDAKPTRPEDRLNRWCSRQCERSVIVKPGVAPALKDFSARLFNMPFRHK